MYFEGQLFCIDPHPIWERMEAEHATYYGTPCGHRRVQWGIPPRMTVAGYTEIDGSPLMRDPCHPEVSVYRGWMTSRGNFLGFSIDEVRDRVYCLAIGRRHGIPWRFISDEERDEISGRPLIYITQELDWNPWDNADTVTAAAEGAHDWDDEEGD